VTLGFEVARDTLQKGVVLARIHRQIARKRGLADPERVLPGHGIGQSDGVETHLVKLLGQHERRLAETVAPEPGDHEDEGCRHPLREQPQA
jgi:hypothetical protein